MIDRCQQCSRSVQGVSVCVCVCVDVCVPASDCECLWLYVYRELRSVYLKREVCRCESVLGVFCWSVSVGAGEGKNARVLATATSWLETIEEYRWQRGRDEHTLGEVVGA
jgi:uncharacterized membrane protein